MTKRNTVIIDNVHCVEDIISLSPINATITHNVDIIPMTGTIQVMLTPNREGVGHGWDTLADDIRECLEIARDRAEIPMGEGIVTVWR